MSKPEINTTPPGMGRSLVLKRRTYGRTAKITKPEDLPLGWEEFICSMGEEGLSMVEMRAELDISIKLWESWRKDWPAFAEVVERALDLAQAWWHRAGRQNLGNKFFNANLYENSMRLRFGNFQKKQYVIEVGNTQETDESKKVEDRELDELFTGGDGLKPHEKAKPKADDADFTEVK